MDKRYLESSVFEAFQDRLSYVFSEFDYIYVSFSGGKDSGLLLNLVLDYKRKYNIKSKIGVFHQDFEAQYSMTTEYVEKMFEDNLEDIEPYWVCLPMATRTAVGNHEMFWYPWDDEKEELWVRRMPDKEYVINQESNPFTYYKYKMKQESLAKQFGRWMRDKHKGAKVICLLGTRASESLQRYCAIVNKQHGYKGKCWITKEFKNVWTASPLYDWGLEDVWVANYKFDYEYNKIYDLFYKAGLPPRKMRVASPFNDSAKESLNLYKILDPEVWVKLVARVQGANFTSIYGKTKAMGYRSVKLPEGHTWKSFTYFLLDTLPENIRNNYIKKFSTSIDFWNNKGGGLPEIAICELIRKGYNIERNGISNHTKDKKSRVIFLGDIPDDTDDIKFTKDIPSWKRMCYCILKNDHMCKFMGFSPTKEQRMKTEYIKKKYEKFFKIGVKML
ncbi:DUF3440 domain-containing protein [Clostridioides sp. ZZV14-6153]|uniref:phosphoadenosine phosphosulfate reductase n=1 Tax=Clostridioides sp. ZZV14-6153 TaxID=2811494 RepID=UPI001D12D13C|nr:DUF3440 domain-containing protein [Clostridioides sp. ZZV14-6153]